LAIEVTLRGSHIVRGALGREYSENTASDIDQDMRSLLEERHEIARQLLTATRDRLDQLVQTLLRDETVDETGLAQILGPRPQLVMEVLHGFNA